jgi:hypothetical protein
MKNGKTYETTEAAEKHFVSSKRIDKRAEASGGGEKTQGKRVHHLEGTEGRELQPF